MFSRTFADILPSSNIRLRTMYNKLQVRDSDWGRVISTCTSPSLGRWPEDLRLSLEADSETLAWLELMLSGWDMRSRYTVRFQFEGSAEFREGMVKWIMPVWSSAGG